MTATFFCSVIGILFAISIYLLLSRNLLRWLLGIAILSSSANLIILIAGRLTSDIPPFIEKNQLKPLLKVANPLPQALILTAIVIGFGLLVFTLVLIRKIWQQTGCVDSAMLQFAEPRHHKPVKRHE
ncbi:NADH-quinone oxidoreductase subunit K [Legionella clemsonensis]|uniref:Na(+)/H(+) antiporter subunit C1 n=1 Tax=Legionella clemsonensis TaxID=1867846 RepID=A0A222P1P5_9GAMM|nr:NADH-quinone oxidoreductase subunit K [Legionella clemsonensis]ASQ45749.1 Na(+)/H(+) antiporter subunit C1 [Legionella clemsonensis]